MSIAIEGVKGLQADGAAALQGAIFAKEARALVKERDGLALHTLEVQKMLLVVQAEQLQSNFDGIVRGISYKPTAQGVAGNDFPLKIAALERHHDIHHDVAWRVGGDDAQLPRLAPRGQQCGRHRVERAVRHNNWADANTCRLVKRAHRFDVRYICSPFSGHVRVIVDFHGVVHQVVSDTELVPLDICPLHFGQHLLGRHLQSLCDHVNNLSVHILLVHVFGGVQRQVQVGIQAHSEPRVLEYLGNGNSMNGIYDQHFLDEIARACAEMCWERKNATSNLLEEVGNVIIVEWEAATQEGVQNDTAAPHINLGAGIQLAGDDLGRCVVGRAARRLQKLAVFHDVGQPKVRDLHVQLRVQQQVLRLEVAVHHTVLVAVSNCRYYLLEEPTRF
mmetsp:Transcript_48676/g.122474  ORF Transcript_48676/g.122474 Transcript_48676/m.122474 type:complete len:390 (+) Transcript_48676:324-1493(+)